MCPHRCHQVLSHIRHPPQVQSHAYSDTHSAPFSAGAQRRGALLLRLRASEPHATGARQRRRRSRRLDARGQRVRQQSARCGTRGARLSAATRRPPLRPRTRDATTTFVLVTLCHVATDTEFQCAPIKLDTVRADRAETLEGRSARAAR